MQNRSTLRPCLSLLLIALASLSHGASVPLAPSHFHVVPGDGQVTLRWDPVPGANAYYIKRSTSATAPPSIVATNAPDSSRAEISARNGTASFYSVSAILGEREGPDTVRLRATASAPVLDWLPAGAKVEKLAGNFQFTEGPAWVPDQGGHLVFSDINANRLVKWTPAGASTFRTPSANANGNTVDLQGRLLTCEHSGKRVSRTEPDGSITALVTEYNGKRFNSPNDVVVKSDATVWFTDPTYGGTGQPGRYVYRCDPAAGNATVMPVVKDFDQPNGLCFSPDEKRLYIADSGGPHHVRVFDVLPDNTLANSSVFAVITPGVPDGIRADAAGNLYVTAGDGVQIFSPDGTLLGKVRTTETAANVGFGGANREMMFITANTSLYGITRLPDLVVTAIQPSPVPIAGRRIGFSLVLKNQGTATSPIGMSISLVVTNSTETNHLGTATLPEALPPDASIALPVATESSGAWAPVAGVYRIRALADSAGQVRESNEANNTFTSTVTVAEAPLDTDADGLADADEVVAGTDPASAQSALRIVLVEANATGLTLRWASVAGRNYRIACTTNLAAPDWGDLSDTITATGSDTTWTTQTLFSTNPTFLRVRVVP